MEQAHRPSLEQLLYALEHAGVVMPSDLNSKLNTVLILVVVVFALMGSCG